MRTRNCTTTSAPAWVCWAASDSTARRADITTPPSVGSRCTSPRIAVTCTAGLSAVPAHVRLAALITVQHLWETQRGGRDRRFTGNEDAWNPGMGYALPRRALELLGDQVSGIA